MRISLSKKRSRLDDSVYTIYLGSREKIRVFFHSGHISRAIGNVWRTRRTSWQIGAYEKKENSILSYISLHSGGDAISRFDRDLSTVMILWNMDPNEKGTNELCEKYGKPKLDFCRMQFSINTEMGFGFALRKHCVLKVNSVRFWINCGYFEIDSSNYWIWIIYSSTWEIIQIRTFEKLHILLLISMESDLNIRSEFLVRIILLIKFIVSNVLTNFVEWFPGIGSSFKNHLYVTSLGFASTLHSTN